MQYIHLWQVVAMAILVAGLIYFKRQREPKKPSIPGAGTTGGSGTRKAAATQKVEETPEAAFLRLRQQAVETPFQRLGLPDSFPEGEPFGALMELGIPNSVVTLACFADGDARLFYKTGGGMVGGGSHENVRKAAKDFLTLAQKVAPRMTKTTTYPVPATDRVRFYVLTRGGVATVETGRQSLGESQTALSALFYSGQEVVTQMRQVQEERKANAFVPPPAPLPDPEPEPEPVASPGES